MGWDGVRQGHFVALGSYRARDDVLETCEVDLVDLLAVEEVEDDGLELLIEWMRVEELAREVEERSLANCRLRCLWDMTARTRAETFQDEGQRER